jgi:hypothetical protein
MPHLSNGNEAGFSGITDKSRKEFRTPVENIVYQIRLFLP